MQLIDNLIFLPSFATANRDLLNFYFFHMNILPHENSDIGAYVREGQTNNNLYEQNI